MPPLRRAALFAFAAALSLPSVPAAQEPVDTAMAARIRSEGYGPNSTVIETFQHLVTVIGPRLTNSPAHRRSVAWTEERLKAMGLANVHTEGWEFGRGWTLTRFSAEMVAPRYMPLIGYPKGWSPSTAGRLEGTPVWMPAATAASVNAAGPLKGAIVMASPEQKYFIRADRPPASGDLQANAEGRPRLNNADQQALTAALKQHGAGVVLEPSIGEHGTVFVTGRDQGANGVPSVVLAAEHYNLIARMLQQKVPVTLAIDVQAAYNPEDTKALNLLAEIPGTDPAIGDEVVMMGAHLDSWHTSEGATDNADGVATVMEAFRILKALGVKPRRTIRLALWGGEEQGLLGSRAWVAQHLTGPDKQAARDRMSVYFNLDNGYPPISGFYMEGNEAFRPIMEAWLKPLGELGATTATPKGIGATDHLSFKAVGVPGFQAIQRYVDYDVRTHHTNMDASDRIQPDALKQASVVMATVLYQAAMRDQKVPR